MLPSLVIKKFNKIMMGYLKIALIWHFLQRKFVKGKNEQKYQKIILYLCLRFPLAIQIPVRLITFLNKFKITALNVMWSICLKYFISIRYTWIQTQIISSLNDVDIFYLLIIVDLFLGNLWFFSVTAKSPVFRLLKAIDQDSCFATLFSKKLLT